MRVENNPHRDTLPSESQCRHHFPLRKNTKYEIRNQRSSYLAFRISHRAITTPVRTSDRFIPPATVRRRSGRGRPASPPPRAPPERLHQIGTGGDESPHRFGHGVGIAVRDEVARLAVPHGLPNSRRV